MAEGCSVHAKLALGSRVTALVRHSDGVQLLVLGAEHRSPVSRVWRGALAANVAARADCPVVVIPPEWEPAHAHHRVVVGFKSVEHSAALLGTGFALAADRRAELVILHAWKLPAAYADIIESRVVLEDWKEHITNVIEPLIADLRDAHPDVLVRLRILHDQPAHALVEASRDADLVVLLRPTHEVLHHLGGTARALLREARCPVEVIPADIAVGGPVPATSSLGLEESGSLLR